MKKIPVLFLVGILFLTACENNNSPTVGVYENDETSASADKKDDTSKEHSNISTQSVRDESIDTAKNITGITRDSIPSKNKKDTSFSAEKKNVKMQKTKKIQARP